MKNLIPSILLLSFLFTATPSSANDSTDWSWKRKYKSFISSNMLNYPFSRVDLSYEYFPGKRFSLGLNFFKGKAFDWLNEGRQRTAVLRAKYFMKKSGLHFLIGGSYTEKDILFPVYIVDPYGSPMLQLPGNYSYLGLAGGLGYRFIPFVEFSRFQVNMFLEYGINHQVKGSAMLENFKKYEVNQGRILRAGFEAGIAF